ncbi:MAG: iron uptake porin [Elainella sp. Prado103]|jgi:hypothetical protein|nr:iron uptake porin [Elainella sp. Prado103]
MSKKVWWEQWLLMPAVMGAAMIEAPVLATTANISPINVSPINVSPINVSPIDSELVPESIAMGHGSPATIAPATSISESSFPALSAGLELAQAQTVDVTGADVTGTVGLPTHGSNQDTQLPVLDQMTQYTGVDSLTSEADPMAQVTSITQFSDVQPTDWAYQALQSLVERYGCIVGYPDGTYKGQRALTRFEFAAGMNACLDRISELLAASTADLATKEDLATLQRLQEEFAAELAALRGRVDVLEARTTALEANQFSTTTKLGGETLFYVADIFNEDEGFENQTVGQYRSRLIFDTSFAGTDLLRARLQAGNLQPFNQPGNEFGFGAFGNTGGDFRVDLLSYQFGITDSVRVNLFANGGGLDDATFGNTINPLDNPARSAITRFGARNAVYRVANTSAGAAVNFILSDNISLQAAYLAGENSNPDEGSGLFNGNYGALGQLTFRNIFDVVDLAFTYVNSYTGIAPGPDDTTIAGVPFGLGSRLARVDADRPVIANSYGVEANFKITPGFQIGGWAGFSAIRAIELGDADVWNYAGTLAFPDLLGRGNLAGLIFGMQPRLTGSTEGLGEELGRRQDPDVGFHLEGFYRVALNDNIDITPGVIWITAPNHDEDNNDLIMGVVRTTFRF